MKSYYSIMLFILFAVVMAVTVICNTVIMKKDFSPADGAIISLTILAIMLAFRLSQAEKRIAHLEEKIEKSKQNKVMNSSEIIDQLEEKIKDEEEKPTTKV